MIVFGTVSVVFRQAGVSLVATDCPGCVFQMKANLKKEAKKIRVVHTAQLWADAVEKNSD